MQAYWVLPRQGGAWRLPPLPGQGLHNGPLCKPLRHSTSRPFCQPRTWPRTGKTVGEAVGFPSTPSLSRFPAPMAWPCPLLGFTIHLQSHTRKAVSATRLRRSQRGTRRNASQPCLMVGIARRDLAASDVAELSPLLPSCSLRLPRSPLPPKGGGWVTFCLVWLTGSPCLFVMSLWWVGCVPPPLLRAAFGRVAPPLPPSGGGGGYHLSGCLFLPFHFAQNHEKPTRRNTILHRRPFYSSDLSFAMVDKCKILISLHCQNLQMS